MHEIKNFLFYFCPALVWGWFHYDGIDLVSFLLNITSAIFGFFAASKWIMSAQSGRILIEKKLTDEEHAYHSLIQVKYNSDASLYAAFSAIFLVFNQLLPVLSWYIDTFTPHTH